MKMILDYRDLDTDGLIYLGEIISNVRCNSRDKYYSKPSDLAEAQIEFDSKSAVMKKQSDRYYSQRWV